MSESARTEIVNGNEHIRAYESVSNRQINPSNILTFHATALHNLIALTDTLVKKYRVLHPDTTHTGKELEDTASNAFGVHRVATMLDQITARGDELVALELRLAESLNESPKVFVPPNTDERFAIQTGSGNGMEKKKLFARLLTLSYMLEHDLDLVLDESYTVVQGSVSDMMFRETPYIRVLVDAGDTNRVVYLCNEEGNATYIFDTNVLQQLKIPIESLDVTIKATFQQLTAKHPAAGKRIIYNEHTWRQELLDALTQNFKEVESQEKIEKQDGIKPRSDFEPKIEIPKRKEGWESTSSLITLCHAGYITIEKMAGRYRDAYPKWFEKQKTGSRTTEHYHPELVAILKKYFSEISKKKEGWESASALRSSVNSTEQTIMEYVNRYRDTNGDWFEEQKTAGRQAEHYHPDLVALIKVHLNKIPRKRLAWESTSSLEPIVSASRATIKAYAETFRPAHSEWFEMQRTGGKHIEHYHHNLARLIIEHFDSIPTKKDGWESSRSLISVVRTSSVKIEAFANIHRANHPKWFEMQRTGGKHIEHYHPDLARLIIEHFSLIPQKKKGWESASSLGPIVGVHFNTIKAYVETFRLAHSEWFEEQKIVARQAEFYHPELVAILKKYFAGRKNSAD